MNLAFGYKAPQHFFGWKFCPKILNFGLAKICSKEESIISMLGARATVGYIALELFCRNFGGVSQ